MLSLSILLLLAPLPSHAASKPSICYSGAASTLVVIAKLQGFYRAEGSDFDLHRSSGSQQALADLFSGECVLATSHLSPIAHHSLHRNDFRIIATIAESNNIEKLIVRSDRGILTPADLRGRRIALSELTTAHYFLDIYLAAHNLNPQDVTRISLPAKEVEPAFRSGKFDAAVLWEPKIQTLAKAFGPSAKIFAAPGLHISPLLLVSTRDYLRTNRAAIERLLRALLRAERFAQEQPASAKALMARHYNLPQSEADALWPLYDFHVALEQPLLFILENATRGDTQLLPPAQRPALPNYLDLIDFAGLMAVKPEAVTIIH